MALALATANLWYNGLCPGKGGGDILPDKFIQKDSTTKRIYIYIYIYIYHPDRTYLNGHRHNWTSNTCCEHLSGGKNTEQSKLRREGCSVIQMHSNLTANFRVSFNLPGQVQSVGRVVLLALSVLAMHLLPYPEVTVFRNNLYGSDTDANKHKTCSNSRNYDVLQNYSIIFNDTFFSWGWYHHYQ